MILGQVFLYPVFEREVFYKRYFSIFQEKYFTKKKGKD